MAGSQVQAKHRQTCIYLHTAAGRGKRRRYFDDSGEMWIALLLRWNAVDLCA
ncbi:MAG: hypothetical protein QOJ96_898 [Alphaproteobacteria bacterium]|jgi:hypothetical protein|nr:hypothetical protein [Alphaproteobacteria bacterium]